MSSADRDRTSGGALGPLTVMGAWRRRASMRKSSSTLAETVGQSARWSSMAFKTAPVAATHCDSWVTTARGGISCVISVTISEVPSGDGSAAVVRVATGPVGVARTDVPHSSASPLSEAASEWAEQSATAKRSCTAKLRWAHDRREPPVKEMATVAEETRCTVTVGASSGADTGYLHALATARACVGSVEGVVVDARCRWLPGSLPPAAVASVPLDGCALSTSPSPVSGKSTGAIRSAAEVIDTID
mmetsp:Transcript_4638/g.15025  ORF Transcript_4638/g.15025 Transcript_4638/m.15025 type:complete len:246 (-) Transcript_4638:459-1196(-)